MEKCDIIIKISLKKGVKIVIGSLDWARSEFEQVRRAYERYLKEAAIQQVTIYQVAGRENLHTLEERLQEPTEILGSSTRTSDLDLYCGAIALQNAISSALASSY